MVVLSLLLAACGSGGTTSPPGGSNPTSNPAPSTLTPGVLTVGSDTTYPPQEYIDPTQNPSQFEAGGSVVFPGPEGIVVRKNDSSLFNAIQAAYKQLKTAGTYRQLILKWGLTNEELTAVDRRLNYA